MQPEFDCQCHDLAQTVRHVRRLLSDFHTGAFYCSSFHQLCHSPFRMLTLLLAASMTECPILLFSKELYHRDNNIIIITYGRHSLWLEIAQDSCHLYFDNRIWLITLLAANNGMNCFQIIKLCKIGNDHFYHQGLVESALNQRRKLISFRIL
jgi:hypothetical protein